jgi:hypothetical protein
MKEFQFLSSPIAMKDYIFRIIVNIVCVVLCTVFRLIVVLFYVMCVVSYCSITATE